MNLEEFLFSITGTSHWITLIILTLMLHLMRRMIVLGCATQKNLSASFGGSKTEHVKMKEELTAL